MDPGNSDFLSQLQRRRVFRAVVAYLIVGAGAVEVADIVLPRLGLPDWTVTLVVWLAVLGLPLAIWLAWAFDLSARGLRRAEGEPAEGGGERTGVETRLHRGKLAAGAVLATGVFAVLLMLRPWAGGPSLRESLPAGRLQPLTSGQVLELHPAWSPDGSSIAFGQVEKGDMDIFVMGLTGDPLPVTTHPADDVSPRYSPDGTRIAFLSDRGAGMDVYWVSPTGGRERRVARTGIPLLDFGTVWFRGLGAQPWSPEGDRILFPRLDESGSVAIWMVNLETGEEARVTDPPPGALDLGAAWAGDGRRILFDRTEGGQNSLWLIADVGARAPEARRISQPGVNDFGASWLPDGSGIVFASGRSGSISPWVATVEDLAGAAPLPSPSRWVYQLAVSGDGAVSMATANHLADLFVGTVGQPSDQHRNVSRSTANNFGATFLSADELVYHSDRAGNYDIWVYRRSSEEHVPLTEDPAFDVMASASPTRDLVFASDREGGALRPWVLDAGETEPRLLLDRAVSMECDRFAVYCRGPRWSPDGRLIGMMLAGDQGSELWVVRPDGSDARRVDVSGILAFDWFRDSERIIYARRAEDVGEGEIRARNLGSGTDTLMLTGFYGGPAVSPSGARLSLLTSQSHYHMDAVMVELEVPAPGGLPRVRGEPVPLTRGGGAWHTHNLAWAPDGETFAYTRDTDSGDIYVLELPEGTGR